MSSSRFFAPDDPPGAARVADQHAGIGRLAAAARIEDRPLQEDGVRIVVDLDHGGLDRARVRIGVADVLAHPARLAQATSNVAWTGSAQRADALAGCPRLNGWTAAGHPYGTDAYRRRDGCHRRLGRSARPLRPLRATVTTPCRGHSMSRHLSSTGAPLPPNVASAHWPGARSGGAAEPLPHDRRSRWPPRPTPIRTPTPRSSRPGTRWRYSMTVNGGTASPTNFNYYAFVHLAMYNAVVAITGEYELYKWDGVAPKVASPEAAAAAAAHRILTNYFPGINTTNLDAQLAASLANVRNPVARANGQAFGIEAANHIIDLRMGDGRGATVTVPTQGRCPGNGDRRRPCTCLFTIGMARWRHTARPDLDHPVRPRRASGHSTQPSTSLNSRRSRASGRSTALAQTFQNVDGVVLLRRGHLADAACAAGVRPAARAGHRRQRPAVRRGGHGHRRRSQHHLECEAPGHSSGGRSRRFARATPIRRTGQLDAVGHYAAVSRLAERTCSVVGATGTAMDTPQRFGRPEHHVPGRGHGPQPRHYADRTTFNADAVNARVWSGIHFRSADDCRQRRRHERGELRARQLLPAHRLTPAGGSNVGSARRRCTGHGNLKPEFVDPIATFERSRRPEVIEPPGRVRRSSAAIPLRGRFECTAALHPIRLGQGTPRYVSVPPPAEVGTPSERPVRAKAAVRLPTPAFRRRFRGAS